MKSSISVPISGPFSVPFSGPLSVLVALVCLAACSDGEAPASGGCDGRAVTLSGTDGDDRLVGTEGDDVISAGDGDDRVEGLGGDDVLCGGDGADRLQGGPGDDRLLGERDARVAEDSDYYVWYGDVLVGGSGDDLLDGGTDDRHAADEAGDTVVFTGSPSGVVVDLAAGTARGDGTDSIAGQVRRVEGSRFADRILGSSGDDEIVGHEGADVLRGRAGADLMFAGLRLRDDPDPARHLLVGGPGSDTLIGDAGDDRILGGAGRDEIQGDGGVDVIHAGEGDDNIIDRIDFLPGQVIDGGAGDGDSTYDFSVFLRGRYVDDATGVMDLDAGFLRATVEGETVEVVLTGLEDALAPEGSWDVIGSDGSFAG